LVQGFDANLRQALVQLTFHQLVCSEEGDRLATRLISALMEVIQVQIKLIKESSI
jgi:nuclear pore complex protein Nup155